MKENITAVVEGHGEDKVQGHQGMSDMSLFLTEGIGCVISFCVHSQTANEVLLFSVRL